MTTRTTLPADYAEKEQIDLQKNKKLMLLVNGLAVLLGLVMTAAGIWSLFRRGWEPDIDAYFSHVPVFLGGCIVYVVLHELVHGIVMRAFSGIRPRYGFTGLYAYAGSDAYFCRRDYIVVSLAPIVVWGVVLAVLQCLVPLGWEWVVYAVQVVNISGAAGDLYVTAHMSRLPADVLVQDSGVSMKIFARVQKAG